jgi:hypothetical protein
MAQMAEHLPMWEELGSIPSMGEGRSKVVLGEWHNERGERGTWNSTGPIGGPIACPIAT